MSFKIKSLVLVGISALALNGCDSDTVDHIQDELQTTLINAGQELNNVKVEAELEKTFHLSHADAVYVTKHHFEQAEYVSNVANPIFTDVKFNFVTSSVAAGWENTLGTPQQWDTQAENNVRRMLGQIAFIVNTKEFANRFDSAGLEKMDARAFHSGIGDARTIPSNYAAFKDVVNDSIQSWNDATYQIAAFNVSATDKETLNNAHFDSVQGEPKLYANLSAAQKSADLHQNAAQLLRELTHTVGYAHDSVLPNNIPYYVQAITSPGGMNDINCDILLNNGQLQNGVWASRCNSDALDADPATQTPPLTADDGAEYLNINLFARFFGKSDAS
ncbi:hypothetical protein [Vibrio sp. B1Z05]|uniref:hypothetical protein n=1 Tax=Vibrio sp. B1Z05 TaxID=2654980 RepID=UPI00128D4BE6|nr:hypothetical protein [Vibrio sp. B1Z05]MPW36181.1 hypothetical protein [Vibrio sp. B1Z05]